MASAMAVLQVYISVQKLVLNSNFRASCVKEADIDCFYFSAAKTKWPPNVASAYTNGVVRWALKISEAASKTCAGGAPWTRVRPVRVIAIARVVDKTLHEMLKFEESLPLSSATLLFKRPFHCRHCR